MNHEASKGTPILKQNLQVSKNGTNYFKMLSPNETMAKIDHQKLKINQFFFTEIFQMKHVRGKILNTYIKNREKYGSTYLYTNNRKLNQ